MRIPRIAVLVACCLGLALTACSKSTPNEVAPGYSGSSLDTNLSIPSPSVSLPPTVASTPAPSTSTKTAPTLSSKQVLAIAESDASAVAAYDYRTLDAHYAAIAKRMTPAFAKQFNTTAGKLDALIKQSHAVVTVSNVSGSVHAFASDASVDYVTLTQHVSSTTQSKVDTEHLVVTLIRESDGHWLLSALSVMS